MSLFQQAARLNNNGVTALLEGDDTTAIECMAKSIKMMKQELAKPASTTSDDLSSSKKYVSNQAIETVEIPEMDDSSEHVVFNQAIHIPCEEEPRSEIDIHIYSAVVILNLAIAHHQQGLKGGAISYMNKAEKLYSMVLKLVDDSACRMPTAVVVKLAAICNLTQMRFATGDFENAQVGLNQVSSFMQQANQRIFDEPQVQGLLMNVLLLKAPKVAPAA